MRAESPVKLARESSTYTISVPEVEMLNPPEPTESCFAYRSMFPWFMTRFADMESIKAEALPNL